MRIPNIDQSLVGTALVAALGSMVWFGCQSPAQSRVRRSDAAGSKARAIAYAPGNLGDPVVGKATWPSPAPQGRGAGWIYDVFTPPEIFYDAPANRFVVEPPSDRSQSSDPDATAAGLELVAVKREPFRLQLLGYVGRQGNYLGTFENRLTTGVFLAAAGRQVPELDLMITDFTVQRQPVPMADGTLSNQWVATAVVRDELTGRSTTLTVGELGYTDELCAVLAAAEDGEEGIREVRQGEEIESLDRTYRIERLQLEPPTVELSGRSADWGHPVRLNLTPRDFAPVAAVKTAN